MDKWPPQFRNSVVPISVKRKSNEIKTFEWSERECVDNNRVVTS